MTPRARNLGFGPDFVAATGRAPNVVVETLNCTKNMQ